jgi:hypothetical protein
MSMVKAMLPWLGLLAVAALLVGGAILLTRGHESPSTSPEATSGGQTSPSIPPIDSAAPARVETATLALG